jgi:hypothetical protein
LLWNLRLSEYDFEIEHCRETQIRYVDALSRHVKAINTNQIISKERVKIEQNAEKFCKSIEAGKFKGESEYIYDEDGVIYRRRMIGEH